MGFPKNQLKTPIFQLHINEFFRSGINYVVTKGSEYEYWDESSYKATEDTYRCFVYKITDLGLQLSQGLGRDCNGIRDFYLRIFHPLF